MKEKSTEKVKPTALRNSDLASVNLVTPNSRGSAEILSDETQSIEPSLKFDSESAPSILKADATQSPTPASISHAKTTSKGVAEDLRTIAVTSNLGSANYIWSLRAPLFLLAAIAIAPKVVILWIVIVLIKPLITLIFKRLPVDAQNNIIQRIPPRVRCSGFLRDMGEGANQCLPFILFWLYLCCAPFAVLWIAGHWVRGFFPAKQTQVKDGFVFGQNMKRDLAQPENNFYYSRAFGLVILAFFALGIPAFFSYSLYQNLGIEKDVLTSPFMRTPNRQVDIKPPKKRGFFIGGYKKAKPVNTVFQRSDPALNYLGTNATFVTGYSGYWPMLNHWVSGPTKANMFFVHFYLLSLACAISVLFFRAWFFFPLNFLSDEHEILLTASGIRRTTMKNWFLNVLTINRWAIGGGPDSLDWNEVKSLRHLEEGFTKLSPLPDSAFKKESLAYKLLNKLASLIDGLTTRVNTGNYLVFSTSENKGDFGRNLKINLNDLNREQRARLFYSVKSWAPHVVFNAKAEELLLGSVVLQDVRYTQLWFDLLTSKTKVTRQSTLTPGESLRDGTYIIEERLSAGGQATAYLAKTASGNQVVLKEFILAITSSPGALIESAREFETEVSLLSQLNNPGIVRLEDFFTEEGRVYVVLEYVKGQTLRQKVQSDGPLSEGEVVNLTLAICNVLEYLHNFDPPIVHRDVTPENILVLPEGTIKLIDFSLAVKNDGHSTTDSCGKQAFTPPEQFREESCPQSDIYGLGATMYFMLTGVPPKPISASSPKNKAPHISDKLNKVVERATQLDLAQRYENVHWLKLDIVELVSPTPSVTSLD